MHPEKIGKFEIHGVLGQGAMGQVYLGKDPLLGREVAIKTILAAQAGGEEARARFLREAQAAGTLNHPGIVTIHEFGEDQGLLYLAMERVKGEDLSQMIRSGSLTRPQVLEVIAQVCEALEHAHKAGIIHRDIKPANVMVGRASGRFQVKLMDFGIARLEGSNLTSDGTWMGTIGYMAPEYLETGKADARSDLFAVGVMLFESLTGGRKPFPGETPTMILSRMMRQEPDALTPQDLEGLPLEVGQIVARLMSKDPSKRPVSAGALAGELQDLLNRGTASFIRPAANTATEPTTALKKPQPGAPTVVGGPPGSPPGSGPNKLEVVVGKVGQGQVLSLKVAVRHAAPGAVIRILPGMYRENVVLDKPITLIGEGPREAIAIEGVKGPGLVVRSEGVRLENLSLVVGSGAAMPDQAALEVAGGQATVAGCHVESHRGPGIIATGKGTRLLVSDSLVQKSDGAGVSARDGAQVTVEASLFAECKGGGVEVHGGSQVHLKTCKLQKCGPAGLLVLENGQAQANETDFSEMESSAVHVLKGGTVQLRQCRLRDGHGMGISVLGGGTANLEGCAISGNAEPGVRILKGATVVLRGCRLHDGKSLGVLCGEEGQGLLEQCELYGNALSGARVERGGSLALVRCVVRDGQDTGLMVLEAGQATLEECVVHRNARGGILLAKAASDPILRGGRMEDLVLREGAGGQLIRMAPSGER